MAQAGDKKTAAPRARHVPQRTCIACRRSDAKRGLIRLVRGPDGHVGVDATGKRPGRGAYLCHDRACWEAAVKRRAIERALKLEQLPPDDRTALLDYARTLSVAAPAESPVGPNRPAEHDPADAHRE